MGHIVAVPAYQECMGPLERGQRWTFKGTGGYLPPCFMVIALLLTGARAPISPIDKMYLFSKPIVRRARVWYYDKCYFSQRGYGLRRMVGGKKVPRIVVQRLPLYLRVLSDLEKGSQITSRELGEVLGISSAQIRKDLSYFGGFGKQGAGYQVGYLRQKLRQILNLDREWEMALVGVGDLGHAIARYGGFKKEGFHVVAAFDNDPAKIGKRVGGLEIRDVALLPKVVKEMGLEVGIIAVPASEAQEVATTMVASGIKAILNYAPVALTVREGVQLYQSDPLVGLQSMGHYLEG